jgi:hypothetical protein
LSDNGLSVADMTDDHRLHLKRVAIELVTQLPEKEEDAMRVLRYATEVVTGFLRAGRVRDPTAIHGDEALVGAFRHFDERDRSRH